MSDAPRDLGAYIQGDRFVKTRDFRLYPEFRWKLLPRMRRSKARREADCYAVMRSLGVPCPQDVRIREERNAAGLLQMSEISMEYLPNTADLRFICLRDEHRQRREDPAWRRAVLTEVARWVKVMHDHHFFPQNLHFRNILVDVETAELPPPIYFIDCVSGRFARRWRRDYYLERDIAFLYMDARSWCTLRERIRFLHLLWGRRKLTPEDRSRMARIAAYAQRKWGDRSSTVND